MADPWLPCGDRVHALRLPAAAVLIALRLAISSTSTMAVKPANCFAKSVVACLNWLAAIAPPALLVTGVPTVTVPFTAGNNVLTPPSINVLAITAPITSRNNKP
jgi:hypothetical protein